MRLNEKTAIVTGAGSGIGKATAELFAKEGCKVILTDVNITSIERIVEKLKSEGHEAYSFEHDVANKQDWQNLVNFVIKQEGSIEILVNNAGISQREGIEDTTIDEWESVQSTNLSSVFLGMKYIVPEMKKARMGSIINVSSIYGIIGSGVGSAYAASKSGIVGLTKTVAIEVGNYNIRVNTIVPGMIETTMTQVKLRNEKLKEYFLDKTCLPHLGNPIDIANGAMYLASDESRFVTGSELIIDGGYTAQ